MSIRVVTLFLLILISVSAAAQVPRAGHVFVVVEENHSYTSVMSTSAMPYLKSLATKYSVATQYYANTHPSIGNYFMLTTGRTITRNDSYTGLVTGDNLARRFLLAGLSWKSYAEGLPWTGYTGGNTGLYMKRHNPFAYLAEVANSSSERLNLVPFSHFARDRQAYALPRFSFIVPNRCHDAHDCSLATADAWLKTNIAPLIASSTFQKDGLLIILFDESAASDTARGGGHIVAVLVGPRVKNGYRSTTVYQHQSTLRLVLQSLGVNSFPGAAAYAPSMKEFFK